MQVSLRLDEDVIQYETATLRRNLTTNYRRNFRGFEGYAYPHFLKWRVPCPRFWKRHSYRYTDVLCRPTMYYVSK